LALRSDGGHEDTGIELVAVVRTEVREGTVLEVAAAVLVVMEFGSIGGQQLQPKARLPGGVGAHPGSAVSPETMPDMSASESQLHYFYRTQ